MVAKLKLKNLEDCKLFKLNKKDAKLFYDIYEFDINHIDMEDLPKNPNKNYIYIYISENKSIILSNIGNINIDIEEQVAAATGDFEKYIDILESDFEIPDFIFEKLENIDFDIEYKEVEE